MLRLTKILFFGVLALVLVVPAYLLIPVIVIAKYLMLEPALILGKLSTDLAQSSLDVAKRHARA